MSEHEWRSFCKKIDKALKPVGPLRQNQRCYYRIIEVMVLMLCLTSLFLSTESSTAAPFFVFIVSALVFCFITYMGFTSTKKKLQDVKEKVERICRQESRKKPNVSFHFRVSENMTFKVSFS